MAHLLSPSSAGRAFRRSRVTRPPYIKETEMWRHGSSSRRRPLAKAASPRLATGTSLPALRPEGLPRRRRPSSRRGLGRARTSRGTARSPCMRRRHADRVASRHARGANPASASSPRCWRAQPMSKPNTTPGQERRAASGRRSTVMRSLVGVLVVFLISSSSPMAGDLENGVAAYNRLD